MLSVDFGYTYYREKCGKCGRKILVEMLLFGVPHHTGVSVTCASCLEKSGLPELFKKQRPGEAADIEQWIKEGRKRTKDKEPSTLGA